MSNLRKKFTQPKFTMVDGSVKMRNPAKERMEAFQRQCATLVMQTKERVVQSLIPQEFETKAEAEQFMEEHACHFMESDGRCEVWMDGKCMGAIEWGVKSGPGGPRFETNWYPSVKINPVGIN